MVRILSFNQNEKIDKEFFKKRIAYALEHRKNLGWSATRLIFSEADFLPGLVVDKYGDDEGLSLNYFHLQIQSLNEDEDFWLDSGAFNLSITTI